MQIQSLIPESQILTELGRRLAQMRKQLRMSQTRLAEEAGIGVATLRRIEAGQDSQMETWLKILKALRMISTVDMLLPEHFESPMTKALSETRGRRSGRAKGPSHSHTQSDGHSADAATPWKTELREK